VPVVGLHHAMMDVRMSARAVKAKQGRLKVVAQG
jgi:hypothetical protein